MELRAAVRQMSRSRHDNRCQMQAVADKLIGMGKSLANAGALDKGSYK